MSISGFPRWLDVELDGSMPTQVWRTGLLNDWFDCEDNIGRSIGTGETMLVFLEDAGAVWLCRTDRAWEYSSLQGTQLEPGDYKIRAIIPWGAV